MILGFLAGLGVVCVLAIAGFALAELHAWWERRPILKKAEEWRRNRPRAKITGIYWVNEGLHGPRYPVAIFEVSPRVPVYDVDPITGEDIVHGWSHTELLEAAHRPSEFIEQ